MSKYEFTFPDVGEGLDKGVVLAWRAAQGERVKADQIIAEVETDKAIVEIPSPVSGIVVRLGVAAGQSISVGEVLAVFDTSGNASNSGAPAPSPSPQAGTFPSETAEPSPSPPAPAGHSPVERVRASPATRKLARSLGVDLTAVNGTGGRGQVTREDVERTSTSGRTAQAHPPPAPAAAIHPTRPDATGSPPDWDKTREDTTEALSGLRRQIAINMEEAWRTVPHIFTLEEVEATELVQAREALNQELASDELRLSYLPFFVKACVAALQTHPRFNASLDMKGEQIIYHHRYNIGIATATPAGLIVTVIHDADTKSLPQIAREIDTLARLARERRVTVDQIRGSTFTISNYGSYGAWMGTPIVRPPEVAIAGFGRIHDAVIPVNGEPAVRTMLPLVVSTDHRLNDGEHLGGFLNTLTRYLVQPVRLLGR